MKRSIIALLLALFFVPMIASAMTKEESAKYLQDLMRDKVKDAAKEQIEDLATRIDPKSVKLYKKLAGVISTSELAASICWDLIQLGLETNKERFANQFAMRLRKYIPTEYTIGAELVNTKLEKWFGARIPTEADCTTILRELGKNTFDAITKMSGYEKQKAREAGTNIQNLGAFFINSNLGRRAANIMETGRQMPLPQDKRK